MALRGDAWRIEGAVDLHIEAPAGGAELSDLPDPSRASGVSARPASIVSERRQDLAGSWGGSSRGRAIA